MNKTELWGEILKELSPFGQKYFFFIFIFLFTLIAISLPIENYFGILPSSRLDLLSTKHKILFDMILITTFLANIYMIIKYLLNGLPGFVWKRMIEIREKSNGSKLTKSILKKEMCFLGVMYLVSWIAFVLLPPLDSSKYLWMSQGNIYVVFFIMYMFCIGFIVLTVLLIIYSELIKHVK
ncbi:hypothetical protein [Acinetobacter sp. WZC-1]|uniref:hypothetical protein n=1 Tax=Acinetobacter sp. WZC-1 TaxID=3459034 RepID=UPI00403DCE33